LLDDLLKNKQGNHIIGADFSFSSTGIVVLDVDGNLIHSETVNTKTSDGTKVERLSIIRKRFLKLIEQFSPMQFFSFEKISVMSNHSVVDISMSAGQMLANLPEENPPIVISLAATAIKKAAIGSGSGGKELVLKGVLKQWGEDFNNNDIGDAFVVARVSADLVKMLNIYKALKKEHGEDIHKFLIDLEKMRIDGFSDMLQEAKIAKPVAAVILSMMGGNGFAKENNYDHYRAVNEELFEWK
jgi:Holliday junction resolvasome RuvABC endonuclease subunit